MKKIVALVAVLAMVSVAGASEQVWFTSPGASVQGAPGVSMTLPSAGSYTVQVWLSATDLIYGYDIGLKSTAANAGSNGGFPGNGASGWLMPFSSVGTGMQLFHLGQYGFSTWTGGPVNVATFTLTAVANSEIIGGSHEDGYGWSDDQGNAVAAQYGAFWNADGNPGSWANGPAITVLPEPATLVLLGLGAVALLRRR